MAEGSSIRAGGAYVEFFSRGDKAFQATLDSLKASTQNMAKGVSLAGAAIAAAGVAIMAPFLQGLSVFSEWSSEASRGARLTGISFSQIGPLAAALKTDVDGLAQAVRKMDSFLNEAAHGSGTAQAALQELQLTAEEFNGLSEEDKLLKFADALEKIGDLGHRGALAVQVLGKNGRALALSGGAQGIRDRKARFEGLAGKMTPEDKASGEAYNLANREMKIATQGFWASLGKAAAPAMTEFFQLVTKVMVQVREWTDANRPLLDIIFRIADKVVLFGTGIAFLGSSIYAASFAFSFVGGAISIVGGLLSFITGWVYFAATGFGILTVASYAWGIASAVASGIATAALYAWGTATAIATAIGTFFAGVLFALTGSMLAYDAINLIAIGSIGAFGAGMAVAGFVTAVFWGIVTPLIAVLSFLASAIWFVVSGNLAYTVGMAIATAATFIYKVATAALSIAMGAQASFAWLAAAGTIAYKVAALAASVATFIFSLVMWETAAATTVATGGINLLAAALAILGAVALSVASIVLGAGIAAPFIVAGVAVWNLIKGLGAIGSAFNGIGGLFTGFSSTISGVASGIASSFASAWAATTTGFTKMFGTIVDVGGKSWEALRDAFAVGDWQLMWEIMKISALLVWEQIKQPLEQMWNGWKDAFSDTFSSIWLSLKIMFEEGWGFVKSGFFKMLIAIVTAWNAAQEEIQSATDWARQGGGVQENRDRWRRERETEAANRLNPLVTGEANARRDATDRANQLRFDERIRMGLDARGNATGDGELEVRRLRDAAVIAGDAARIAELEDELRRLAHFAEEERFMQARAREQAMGGAIDGQDVIAAQARNAGTFSASAASGFAGGSPMDRLQRVSEEQRDLLRQIREALGMNPAVVG